MKRTIPLLLTLAALLTLCACGKSESPAPTVQNEINVPEIDTDSIFTPYTKPAIDANANTIEIPDIDISFDIPEYTVGEIDTNAIKIKDIEIDFEIPAYQYEVSTTPVEIAIGDITFEMPDYDFSFDVESFDAVQFAEISADNFSEADQAQIAGMEASEIVAIAETRANLLADLSHAFETSGLAVSVNENTGEVALDSAVLFGVNESDVSDEGKEFLRKFLAVYTTVVFDEKYDSFVSRVLVEGHTDTNGSYDYNLSLSQARAESVMAYCLSAESGVSEEHRSALEASLEAMGYSYDKPVYDEAGEVDLDASRRVSFRFLIALP